MFLAARNQVITNRSLIETMKMFSKQGYDGMELSIVRGSANVLALDYMDNYIIDKVNEVSAELSFPITALACHQNYTFDDTIYDAQKKLLQTARKYNTDVVIMSTFLPFEEREGNKEVYGILEKRTKELCNIAEANGVKIAIEVEPNQLIYNLKTFFEMADKVNSPAFKLNFDVGHIYLSEVDIMKAIERTKEFIAYSHIDNMCMGEHCHKLPWEGEIDLFSVYRKLKESGYDGAVSLDLYLHDYEKVSPRCVEYINSEIFSKI